MRRGAGASRRGGEAHGQPPRRFAPPLLKKGGESEGRCSTFLSPPRMRRGAGDSRRGGEANGQPPRRFAPPLLKKGGRAKEDTWRFSPPRMSMRILLAAVTLAFAAGASAQPATDAKNWPSRAIHMIVPFPAGSSPDLIARVLSEKLAPALGQPVIVENRPGAGGNLGTALVARAAPDGYTIGLSIPGPLAVNTVLYRKMEYDPFKDLAPVSLVGASPNVLVVDPKLNVNSVREFVALAKSQPGKLSYGSV